MNAKVYFDSLCHLCSREIEHYRRRRGSESLDFIDITRPDFDAAGEGLDPSIVHQQMYVKLHDGSIKTGVDAFIAIWQQLPRYQWAAKVGRMWLVRPALDLGYKLFARLRPFLPRRKASCSNSPYCDTRQG